MTRDYIPASDARLVSWSAHLAAQVESAPGEYGVPAPVAAELVEKQSRFAEAFAAAFAPETRGLSTVFRKNAARKELVALLRSVVRTIQGAIGLSDQKKFDLGITVRKTERSRTTAPDVAPGVRLTSVEGSTVNLRIYDAATMRRARPTHVRGAAVFSYVGENPPATLRGWTFEHNTIDLRTSVTFQPGMPPGTTVWFAIQWIGANLQPGPASAPVDARIGFGHALPASRLAA